MVESFAKALQTDLIQSAAGDAGGALELPLAAGTASTKAQNRNRL
jgi:hypothetical protein